MTSGVAFSSDIPAPRVPSLQWKSIGTVVACAWILCTLAPAAVAKEVFKDEAGRVIYTIDDDGIVSMFANSANDITLSVTRGSREKMQPKVTDVTPLSVTAGSDITLQIRGKNLVGAKVAVSIPQIEIGEALGHPKNLDVPIRVPVTVPAGDVAIIVMTPIGRTESRFSVTEMPHNQNAQISAKRNDNATTPVSTAAPQSCPEGMIGIAAERGGFCIDIDQMFIGDLAKAEKSCAIAGKRLCVAAEWHQACEVAQKGEVPLKRMPGNWEWTSSIGSTRPLTSVLVGQADCLGERFYETWKHETISGRCCK